MWSLSVLANPASTMTSIGKMIMHRVGGALCKKGCCMLRIALICICIAVHIIATCYAIMSQYALLYSFQLMLYAAYNNPFYTLVRIRQGLGDEVR